MVFFDLRKFKKFQQAIANGKGLKDVYTQWGKRYLTATKRKFKQNSLGGGDWPPLKSVGYRRAMGGELKTTKSGRRRGVRGQTNMKKRFQSARKKVKILIDTGTLFKALSIKMPGNLFRHLQNGIRVGFAGKRLHKKSALTVKEIAMKHQTGDSKTNLPKRQILHTPDTQLRKSMMRDLMRGLNKLGRRL